MGERLFGLFRDFRRPPEPPPQPRRFVEPIKRNRAPLSPEDQRVQALLLARRAANPENDFMGATAKALVDLGGTGKIDEVAQAIHQAQNGEHSQDAKKDETLSAQLTSLGDHLPHLFTVEKDAITITNVDQVRDALAKIIIEQKAAEKPPETRPND